MVLGDQKRPPKAWMLAPAISLDNAPVPNWTCCQSAAGAEAVRKRPHPDGYGVYA